MRVREGYVFSSQLLLDFIQINGWLYVYKSARVVHVFEGQDPTTAPWLGMWIRDLAVLPVEIDDVVDETDGDLKHIGNLPDRLSFVVKTDDPLS